MAVIFAVTSLPAIAQTTATASITAPLPTLVQRYHYAKYHAMVRIRWVASSGDFAIVDWDDGNSAGTMLLHYSTRWHVVVDGGGIMREREIEQRGVPSSDARSLYSQQTAYLSSRT
jgi:hypothetical protein